MRESTRQTVMTLILPAIRFDDLSRHRKGPHLVPRDGIDTSACVGASFEQSRHWWAEFGGRTLTRRTLWYTGDGDLKFLVPGMAGGFALDHRRSQRHQWARAETELPWSAARGSALPRRPARALVAGVPRSPVTVSPPVSDNHGERRVVSAATSPRRVRR